MTDSDNQIVNYNAVDTSDPPDGLPEDIFLNGVRLNPPMQQGEERFVDTSTHGQIVIYVGTNSANNMNESTSVTPELMFGGKGDDDMRGGSKNDHIHGGPGNDDIDGGAGDDREFGEAGADDMGTDSPNTNEDEGNDYMDGGTGGDDIGGGAGDDTLTDADPPGDPNEPDDVDNLDGGSGNDNLNTSDGDGNDTMDGGPGIDTNAGSDAGDDKSNME